MVRALKVVGAVIFLLACQNSGDRKNRPPFPFQAAQQFEVALARGNALDGWTIVTLSANRLRTTWRTFERDGHGTVQAIAQERMIEVESAFVSRVAHTIATGGVLEFNGVIEGREAHPDAGTWLWLLTQSNREHRIVAPATDIPPSLASLGELLDTRSGLSGYMRPHTGDSWNVIDVGVYESRLKEVENRVLGGTR